MTITYTSLQGDYGVVLIATSPGFAAQVSDYSNSFDVFASMPNQATNIQWVSFGRFNISLRWTATNTNGTQSFVVAKNITLKTNSFNPSEIPLNGYSYTAVPTFQAGGILGNGQQIGTPLTNQNPAFAVLAAAANTVNVTGLMNNNGYLFKVFQFNGAGNPAGTGLSTYNIANATNNPLSRFTNPREGSENLSNQNPLYLNNITDIYPNPAKDRISFKIDLNEALPILVSIYDESGRMVKSPIDNQTYPIGESNIELMMNDLMAGTYTLVVSVGNEFMVQRFVLIP
jgi:hypothetical protein